MTMPNERTRAVVLTWEFLRSLETHHGIPKALRDQASTLLRHYPLPYEMAMVAKHRPELFTQPESYAVDGVKSNTVGTLVELLCRFDPSLRVVVEGPEGGLNDVRKIMQVSIETEANQGTAHHENQVDSEQSTEQVVWIVGEEERDAFLRVPSVPCEGVC